MRCSAEANDLPKLATQDALQLAAAQRVAQRLEVGAREMRQRLAQVSQLQRSIVNLQQHVKLRAEALRQQVGRALCTVLMQPLDVCVCVLSFCVCIFLCVLWKTSRASASNGSS